MKLSSFFSVTSFSSTYSNCRSLVLKCSNSCLEESSDVFTDWSIISANVTRIIFPWLFFMNQFSFVFNFHLLRLRELSFWRNWKRKCDGTFFIVFGGFNVWNKLTLFCMFVVLNDFKLSDLIYDFGSVDPHNWLQVNFYRNLDSLLIRFHWVYSIFIGCCVSHGNNRLNHFIKNIWSVIFLKYFIQYFSVSRKTLK